MYKPTEKEKNNCICIVKDILKIDDDIMCESYVNKIFSIAYSIGWDYGNETLRSIAKVVLKDVWLNKDYTLDIDSLNLKNTVTCLSLTNVNKNADSSIFS